MDPDQTPQNAASDQGLHCLPIIHLDINFKMQSNGFVQILG